jgi:DNA polymerase-3 subunit gamma/tau
LEQVNRAIDAGSDPRQMARQVVDYARNLMLVRMGSAALVEATAETRTIMARQAEKFEVPMLLRLIKAFNTAANEARGGWQPQLPLELAVVESLTISPPAAVAQAEPMATSTPARAAVPGPNPKPTAPAVEPRPTSPTPKAPLAPTPAGMPDLRAGWARVLTLLDKPTAALLRSGKVLGLEGRRLRLATNEFVYKQITTNGAIRERIEQALAEVFGLACVLQCELSGARGKASAGDAPQESIVAEALSLGGEIVE